MVPYVSEVLFNEPQGRSVSLLHCGASLLYLCMFVYAWSIGDAGEVRWVLFFVVGTALAGIAESLPKTRQRVTGILRLTAVLVLVSVLVIGVIAPEILIG